MPEPPPGLLDRARQHARAASEPAAARARRPLRGGRAARGAGPVRAHPERVLRGAERVFRACSACTTSTRRWRAARRASAAGARGARAQPRRGAARRRAARAAARRPRPVRVRGRRRRGLRAAGGRALLAPNGVDDDVLRRRGRRRRARAVLRRTSATRPNRRGRRALPGRGLARRAARARPDARLAIAGGGMDDALRRGSPPSRASRCSALVADLPGAARRGARGRRPDLGGRRHAAEGARGAGRGARGGGDAARRLGVGFEHGRHGLLARRRQSSARRSRPCWPTRGSLGAEGRMLAERYRWPDALAAASAFYALMSERR